MSNNENRKYWLDMMTRIVSPVLEALAENRLKTDMPVEGKIEDRPQYTHLEALGRALTGISPWLETGAEIGEEGNLRRKYTELARKAIANSVDPEAPDFLNFSAGQQPLVDAAFLAHAIIRAPKELWLKLDDGVKANLVKALKASRGIRPYFCNWLLFAAMIETALYIMGEDWDKMRIDYAVKQHEQWYLGDGIYGDGPQFHWDYYNSFVIQPMLVDIIITVGDEDEDWRRLKDAVLLRAKRYAALQEMLISPDGTFPAIGRSIAYRCGAFHSLAQSSLRKELPDNVKPAQVRCALTAVIRRCMEAAGTFDENGWLTIGLSGHQPGLGENYISTGSLYLCTAVFLPLGLSPDEEFWSGKDEAWSSQKVWSGSDVALDHALYGGRNI